MKQDRHQARVIAMQGLFQLDMQRAGTDTSGLVDTVLEPVLEELTISEETLGYAKNLIQGVWLQHDRYDAMLSGVSAHWELSRMAVVDRNILRVALYEVMEQPDVPIRVVFDEAIELGKEFGEAETPHFINGVLDAVWKQHPACRIARPADEAGLSARRGNTEMTPVEKKSEPQ